MAQAKSVTVQLSNGVLKELDKVCEHYRWGRSQGVSEFIKFYQRLREYAADFDCLRGLNNEETLVWKDGAAWTPVSQEDSASLMFQLIQEVNSGILAAFRPEVLRDDERVSLLAPRQPKPTAKAKVKKPNIRGNKKAKE